MDSPTRAASYISALRVLTEEVMAQEDSSLECVPDKFDNCRINIEREGEVEFSVAVYENPTGPYFEFVYDKTDPLVRELAQRIVSKTESSGITPLSPAPPRLAS